MNYRASSVRSWLVLAVVTMIVAVVLTYRTVRESETSNTSVGHTQHVLTALVALEGATADLIFASSEQTLSQAEHLFSDRLDELASLTLDNDAQQARLRELRAQVPEIVRSRRGAITHELLPRTQAIVPQRLSQLIRAIRTEELRLLTERVADDARATKRVRTVLLIVSAGSGALLLWVLGLVVRDERLRRETESVLRRSNEELDARVVKRTAELHAVLEREQELRSEAEAANRLKDEFLMIVSHELRTPLNALLGWADMMRLGIVSSDRQQRALDSIYENAKLQRQLIADLLDTARILTGKLRIDTAPIDLAELVRDAVSVVAPAAEAKGLALQLTVDPDLGTFVADGTRLQQVVWNLVSNAVKFTNQGSVFVTASRDTVRKQVHIVVADTGDGISQEFLPHVFERFRQEKNGIARPHGGLGLGLSITRQLVELHGGTIRAENRTPERGAVFTVTLPLARSEAVGSDGPLVAALGEAMPNLDGVRVLVVDDNAGTRDMVTATLQYCGANVTTAASAAEARRSLPGANWDVLLIDVAMPDEDGYSLIRDLRSRGLHQPAAALTALSRDVDRARALEAGFDVHIPKPVEAHAIAHAVAELASGKGRRFTREQGSWGRR